MRSAFLNCFVVFILLFLSACIIQFEIGENDYRSLTETQRERIMKAHPETLPRKIREADPLKLYEINTDGIKEFASRSELTWVHLWRPWCPNDHCVNIDYLERIHQPYKNREVQFLMVSVSYDFRTIENIVSNTGFSYPILVLENARYGHKLKAARKEFLSELGLEEDDKVGDDFIFADTTLVYNGNIESRNTLDSLIFIPVR